MLLCAFIAVFAAAPARALDPSPFMVGVFALDPEGESADDTAPTSQFTLGVGRVFTIPAAPAFNATVPAEERVLPMSRDVVGLSLTFTQDTTLGFSSYLGLGVGAPTDPNVAGALDTDRDAAYEFSLGVSAPVATGAEVDVGYRFQDSVPMADGEAVDDPAAQRHDFMVGIRYSF